MGLGPDPNYDYLTRPYKPDWKPIPDREWAEKFVYEDGSEDEQGFLREYMKRIPEMFGTVPAWVPPSVNYFLRHDRKGVRLDVDWELAALPLDQEEQEEIKKRRHEQLLARRKELRERYGAVKGAASAPDSSSASESEAAPSSPKPRRQSRTRRSGPDPRRVMEHVEEP